MTSRMREENQSSLSYSVPITLNSVITQTLRETRFKLCLVATDTYPQAELQRTIADLAQYMDEDEENGGRRAGEAEWVCGGRR